MWSRVMSTTLQPSKLETDSCAVMHGGDAFLMRATGAAIKVALGFDTVSDDFAAAMLAFGSERMNGAFKTIEIARGAVFDDLQRLVVIVSANFTLHVLSSLSCSIVRRPIVRRDSRASHSNHCSFKL